MIYFIWKPSRNQNEYIVDITILINMVLLSIPEVLPNYRLGVRLIKLAMVNVDNIIGKNIS